MNVNRLIRIKKSVRTEPSVTVSEFNLGTNNGEKADVGRLVGVLDKVKNVGELKKQLTTASKRSSTLEIPINKQAKERSERVVAYEEAKKQIEFWDETVRQNRLADKIEFPLHQKSYTNSTLETAVERFQSRTTLEIETAKILGQSKNNLTGKTEYTEAEKEALKAMSLEEAEKRKEKLCKIRALITYEAAKNRRKRMIKSKRYHRISKRQKRKEAEKQFAELLLVDPEAAQEKLELLDRDRIKERSTLKHRSTGKWAKQLRQFAKKDPQVREALQQQLRLGKELTEKIADPKSDDERDIADDVSVAEDDDSGEKAKQTAINLVPKLADFVQDDVDDQMDLITEAFADDDVIEKEIAEEMQNSDDDETKRNSLNSFGNNLPGWNSWAGPGIIPKKQKIALPEEVLVKKIKGNSVVISEKANDSIKKYQVKKLPFPFCKSEVFEANLSHPLGKEWNPETSFKMLIEPSVRTKMGTIIKPIDKTYVVKKNKGNWKKYSKSSNPIVSEDQILL